MTVALTCTAVSEDKFPKGGLYKQLVQTCQKSNLSGDADSHQCFKISWGYVQTFSGTLGYQ